MTELERVLEILQRLAWPADNQLRYLVDIGAGGFVDEIALELDDELPSLFKMLERKEISKFQYDKILEIDKKLESVSGEENEKLWTAESLAALEFWDEIRRMSHFVLSTFSESRSQKF